MAVEQVAISADRRAVGWLALYPNCCTTYPIPLKRVALRQAPVHGSAGLHVELRDVRTGRLLRTFDPDSGEVRHAPVWARALASPD